MKKLIPIYALLIMLTFNLSASDGKEAETVIKKTVDDVIVFLQEKSLSKSERREKIMTVINAVFDFELMSKLTLGRDHWSKFQNEKRDEFIKLFIKQLQNSYLDKAELFSDEKIEFGEPEDVKGKIKISTKIITKDSPINMIYRLHKSKETGKWMVYDLEIQDISIIKSYGAQYDEVLKSGSVDDLLKKMNEKFSK